MKVEIIACTKKNLCKIIKWKQNSDDPCTKEDVIREILTLYKGIAKIGHVTRTYENKQTDTVISYKIVIKNRVAALTDVKNNIIYFLKRGGGA